MVGVKPYTLFLQSPCGYACGDHETSSFGQLLPVIASNPSAKAPRTMITRYNAPPIRAYACGEASTA